MPIRGPAQHNLLRVCQLALFVYALITAMGVNAHSGESHDDKAPAILAPGYSNLSFTAPAVGTYALPSLGTAGDGKVIDSDGKPLALASLLGEKSVLMSFVYTTCDDINGCPLATFVLSQVSKRIEADPSLNNRVRLISLSFDPQHDTPKVMQEYGKSFKTAETDWRFLTCDSEATLRPILNRYNQTIVKEYDEGGNASGSYSHILRVYLIDTDRKIRNIYSVSFLHADTIINDIKTLLTESPEAALTKVATSGSVLHGAGDYKGGYDHLEYETRSNYLPNRSGEEQDLLAMTDPPPLGLPSVPVPADNPLTATKISLGRKLFFDRRLSLNQTISCAMCHVPEQGFAHNELATAVGVEGRTVRRNSPTMYNVGYLRKLFHDARDDRLEHQIWQPLLAKNEMANPSVSAVVNKLRDLPDYDGLFEAAFPGKRATLENIGMAIASYERTLVSGNSAFDQWHFGDDESAVDDGVRRGFNIFTGKGRCNSCHLIEQKHALFTDHQVHNTGIGYRRSMKQPPAEPQRVLVAPGIFIDVDPSAVADSAEKPPGDLGYYEITQDPDDLWKYRTPSLRNVDLTAPYMHDGSLTTLEDVVAFYSRGGIENERLDLLIQPIGLNKREQNDLVAFLKSLTGDNVDQILSDAFAAPVGNLEHAAVE